MLWGAAQKKPLWQRLSQRFIKMLCCRFNCADVDKKTSFIFSRNMKSKKNMHKHFNAPPGLTQIYLF